MMDASKILSVLYSEIHSVVVGMIDSARHPSSAFLDVIFAEENAVYFMTSDNGRKLYPDDQRKSAVSSMSFRSMKDMAAIRTSALLLRNRQGSNFIVILNKAGTYE
ncbi:hypothetical protein [Baileyella intestinalis]|uniref:hypothetical protein n=1 Tax=Baileyella intestinalis TaxID=2606709 RepID=UPI0022E8B7FB|nr:hypothetical protein [Baileyella intestinalis]